MITVDELKAMVGQQGAKATRHIDKSMIRLYCDTVGDNNPKWKELVPPGLITAAMFMGEGTHMDWPYPGIVDAGSEWSFYKPIKPGDDITIVNSLDSVEDKSSEKGKRLLISFKSSLTNQNDEVVAESIGRIMNLG